MKQAELIELLEKFDQSSLTTLEYSKEDYSVVFEKKQGIQVIDQPVVTTTPVVTQTQVHATTPIKSPLAGVFYKAASPEGEAFVKENQMVTKGEVVCLVEAMKMINEIKSPVNGRIKSVAVENEEVISYDQVLFEVEEC